jgi:hypothetical protein
MYIDVDGHRYERNEAAPYRWTLVTQDDTPTLGYEEVLAMCARAALEFDA